MHDIAIADNVVDAFEPHAAGISGTLFAAKGSEIGIGDRLGAYEAPLEIGVDLAGRLRCPGSSLDRPGMRFLRAGGKERNQPQQRVASANDAGETGLLEPERRQK